MDTTLLEKLKAIREGLVWAGMNHQACSTDEAITLINTQSAEIERLKGLLREVAEDMENWGWEGASQNYREAVEVTK
jgi:hypothetical protein